MAASQAASTCPEAEATAREVLAAGGSSVDGVIAGFLGAAAAADGVLLGPLVALVAGVGVGARVVDGRACQPGADAPRPRGYREHDAIPDAACAAAPRSVAALALLHAYGAAKPFATLVRPAVSAARAGGYAERARFLESVGRAGGAALAGSELGGAIARAAGPGAGGMMGEADMQRMPGDEALSFAALDAGLEVAVAPWQAPAPTASSTPTERLVEVVVAADSRGQVAALCYRPDPGGVPLPELELRLCRDAEPVRRGVPRVAPGTPCPTPAPIAVLRRPPAGWYASLGIADAIEVPLARFGGTEDGLSAWLEQLALPRGRGACAASVQRRKTKITRV